MADGALGPMVGASAGLNASFRPPPRPSGAAPDGLRPSGQPEDERPAQVDGDAQGLQLDVVARQAQVAHPAVAVGPLDRPEQPLAPGPDRRHGLVERHLPGLERPGAPRPVHDPRLDAPLAQPGPSRLAVVRFSAYTASSSPWTRSSAGTLSWTSAGVMTASRTIPLPSSTAACAS